MLCILLLCSEAGALEIVSDSIPQALDGLDGDAGRGRAIVASRQQGLCLLCHSGPIPEERFQGTLAPSLAGAGSRLSAGQLRLKLVDGQRLNPDSIMPAYFRSDGLQQVGREWRARTIFSAQQLEDVIAYLQSLK
jgi:sulfur-oxidizing protein SoxX